MCVSRWSPRSGRCVGKHQAHGLLHKAAVAFDGILERSLFDLVERSEKLVSIVAAWAHE